MIAYGMLYTVAVGLPITLAALAIAAVLRRYGKPERLVWLGALITALVLPVVALLDPFGGSQPVPSIPETGVIGLPAVVVVPAAGPTLGPGQLLIATWLLISAILALRWAVAALRLARSARSWSPTTLDGVPVWMTEKLGPAVAGTLRPRVLVPAWLRTLPPRQRSLVLLHEQEHIRARDPLLIALARLARVLTPWNPVVWLLSSRLVRAVELDCDRRVLRQGSDVAAYGQTLLTVSERRPGRLVAVAAFAESEAPLRSRILAMTSPPRTVSIIALLTSMVLGVVLLIGALEIPVPTVSVQVSVEPSASAEQVAGPTSPEPAVEPTAAPSPGTEAAAEQDLERREAQGAGAEAPPSAEETLRRLRQEAVERGGRARPTRAPAEPARPQAPRSDDISARPTFTPYTLAPSILNREEVVRAMLDAYPALLRDAGVGGTVRVYFFIDERGEVRDTRIDSSSGHAALDDAALAVAGTYRFSPARNRDRPVPVWVSFPITFQVR
jgi:TonB family protein